MRRALRLALTGLLLLSCVGCDQAAKVLARDALAERPPVSLLHGIVRLQYVENPGAFLSLGAGLPDRVRFLVFVLGTGAILAAGLAFAVRSKRLNRWQKAAVLLAVGGGIGNLIDRIAHGAVVDFVSLGIGPLRTGIFNLADVAITAGLVLLLAGWSGTKPALSSQP
jgi:signal peptidase II